MVADTTITEWVTAVAAVVAALGTTAAAIAAWRSAVTSERASRAAGDALVKQTEQESAVAVDNALRALEVEVHDSEWPSRLGAVHNRWQDDAAIPAMRLRDAETRRRVQIVGDLVFMAMHAAKGEHTSYAFLAAIEDARAALNALLRGEPIPASGFPDRDQLRELCPIGAGGRSFEPLNLWLEQHFPGFRQLT
jgi:hypothetical protein